MGVRQRFAPRRAWAHCLLLLLMLSAHGGETLAQSPQQPLERNLAGSEMHSYRLTLTSGQFIRALFDQRGIDVVVALFAGEEKLLEVDNPGGSWSPEPLFFEVAEAGTYRIEVRPRKESAAPGRYLFSVEMRAPTRADRRRLPADRIFAEATGRLLAKTSEAYAEGLQKYGEARQIYQTIGDRRGEITTLNTMGSVAAALGRWDEALRSYEEALVPLRQVRDRSLEAMILSHLAQVYYNLQDRERALENYERALGLFQSVGDERTAAYTLDQMGAVHDAMGESRRALGFYERALPLFRAAADRRGEAYTLNNIGLVHQGLREKERAQQSFDRALALFEQIADCREVGPVLSNLALERLEEGDRQKALEYLNQALVIQRTVNDREGEATTLNNIGFVYHTMSQRERALEYYGQALALSRETHHRRGEGDTLSNLMFTWKALGRGAVAVFYGKGAVNAFQQVRSEIPALDKEGQRSFVKTKENTYHELAELLITQGRLLEAQQVLDMLKEEEYFEFVRRNGKEAAGQPATLTPAEANQEKRYRELADTLALRGRQRSELLAKASKADLSPAEEQQLTQLEADIQTANQSFQSFLQQLSGELTAEQKSTDKVFQLREAQALMDVLRELGEGSVVLYTLIGEEKYRIILITPDVQLAREYPIKASDLYAKIADYRQALLDPRFDPRPASQELYRIMIAPIAKDLQDAHAQTLMWSLDGALRYVPVASLYDGQKYLAETYRNILFTPASLANLKDVPSARWRALGFGVSKEHENFRALPAVPDELRGIIREEGGDMVLGGIISGRIVLDDAFTEASFRAALRRRYPVVHIASHFQFQPGNETDSFLLLGDGKRLSLAQIQLEQNLFSGVELLTLSACDTASSSAGSNGKEVESFGMLAQRQGAKAVMATLWPVVDESTRMLMQEFYRLRNAQPGLPKAEALRLAQVALLKGELTPPASRGSTLAATTRTASARFTTNPQAPFSHPHFWAPFILIGNWR